MSDHLAIVQRAMSQHSVPVLVVTDPPNIAYISGFRFTITERIAVLLVTADGEVEVVLPYYEEQAARAALPHQAVIHVYNDEAGPGSALKECLAKLQGQGTIGILKEGISLAHYEVIESLVKPRTVVDFSHELAVLRAAKDSDEVGYIRHAGEIADRTVSRLLQEVLRPGSTEAELGGELSRIIRLEGGDGSAHVPNVTSGARSAFPHGPDLSRQLGVRPARELVQEGELVILDFDVLVGGYCADISRTYVLGESKPKQRELFQIVVDAHRAAIKASVVGNTAADVDRAARRIIEDAGYGPLFPHKTGHGVGLQIHEEPSISTSNELPLTEGMVFTVEPAIYVPGYGGVRIEDVVLVTAHGPELLTDLSSQAKLELPVRPRPAKV